MGSGSLSYASFAAGDAYFDQQNTAQSISRNPNYGAGTFYFQHNGKVYGGSYHTTDGTVTSLATSELALSSTGGYVQDGDLEIYDFSVEQNNGGSPSDFWNTADNIGDGISAFASPWALAGGIAEAEVIGDSYKSAAKAYRVAFSKSFQATTQYSKVLGAAGKILGVTGVVTSGMVLWNDPNLTNLTKFGINAGTLFLKANPLGLTISLGVGLLDYTGYLDRGLNYIYNENTGK